MSQAMLKKTVIYDFKISRWFWSSKMSPKLHIHFTCEASCRFISEKRDQSLVHITFSCSKSLMSWFNIFVLCTVFGEASREKSKQAGSKQKRKKHIDTTCHNVGRGLAVANGSEDFEKDWKWPHCDGSPFKKAFLEMSLIVCRCLISRL